MIIRKSPEEIDKIADAGQILARCLTMLRGKARPGVTTADLDQAAEKFITSQGATPAFKGYRGFPGSICASPNSMVVHGIPGAFKLSRGDILSIDVGVVLDGWVADAAVTVPIGQISPVARRLLESTKASASAKKDELLGKAREASPDSATSAVAATSKKARENPLPVAAAGAFAFGFLAGRLTKH